MAEDKKIVENQVHTIEDVYKDLTDLKSKLDDIKGIKGDMDRLFEVLEKESALKDVRFNKMVKFSLLDNEFNSTFAKEIAISGVQLNDENSDSLQKYFFHAASKGDVDGIKATLMLDTDINSKDKAGHTALELAWGNKKAMEYILDHDFDSSMKDSKGYEPVTQAIVDHDVEMLNLLLDHEADIDNVYVPYELSVFTTDMDNSVFNPMNYDFFGNKKVGSTPLHIAAMLHDQDAYDALVEHGADKGVVDAYGHTAEDYLSMPVDDMAEELQEFVSGLEVLDVNA